MDNYNIFISDIASEQIKNKLIKRGTPDGYLRLGVKGSGCVGFQYVLQFDDVEPKAKDIIFNINNINIIIDKKSIIYLNGSTLDYEKSLLQQGFKFINPQEVKKCGCGESFSVK